MKNKSKEEERERLPASWLVAKTMMQHSNSMERWVHTKWEEDGTWNIETNNDIKVKRWKIVDVERDTCREDKGYVMFSPFLI